MLCRQTNDAEFGLLVELTGADSSFWAGNQLMAVENWLAGLVFLHTLHTVCQMVYGAPA